MLRRASFAALLLAPALVACGNDDASMAEATISSSSNDAAARDGAGDSPDAGTIAPSETGDDAPPSNDAGIAPAARSITVYPLPLFPYFSPSIHDYVVRCAAGTNALTVDLAAGDGETFALAAPTITDAAARQTNDVSLTENQAIVAHVDGANGPDDYWIRCLPHDFPQIAMVNHADAGAPSPGYYLLGDGSFASGESGFAMVVDVHGTPVWYRRTTSGTGALNLDLLATNTLSFVPNLGAGTNAGFGVQADGAYELHDLTLGTTRYVKAVGSATDLHELRLLPNGDALIFTYPIETGFDLTGLAGYGPNQTIADCEIQEIDPSGNLVWSWRASDHIDPVKESVSPPTVTVNGAKVVDLYHFNAIDVAANGDLLVSSRHTNALFYVEKATGKVAWKMGGTAYNADGAQLLSIVGDPETTFYRQHDARLKANGHVTLFDDHSGAATGVARGVEYALDLDHGVATFFTENAGTASVAAEGSYRTYDDGSSIVGWGTGTPVFTELDSNGAAMLTLSFDAGGTSYRAIKIPTSAIDIGLLRSTAGAP